MNPPRSQQWHESWTPVFGGNLLAWLAGIALVWLLTAPASAQDDPARNFPNKPIRIIVGYAAGGGNDIVLRLVAPKMAESLGQPVIVENKPGAQSIVAAELVARAAPDGYTLLMGASGPIAINPATYSKLSYSPLRDFAPISMIGSFPLIMLVNSASPIRSVRELVDYAKANPDKANYGASAAPFQLASELLNLRTGARFAYIPYKGSNESINAVMSGQVTMTIADPPPATGPLAGGRVRGLAVTSAMRHPSWPDLPTMAEAGISDIEVVLWSGLLAPAGTPPGIVRKLQEEVARVVRLPEIRERLAGMAIDPVGNTSEEFARIIAADIAKWTAVAKAANIKAD
ncbi:MAG: tripartite tricarboxylate transporter substrate binding protein [Proteobacteria bacterium]|nr:tripartite tricarboxylate transporter substrate binding protein [Pseudomonadota bacterium]